MTEASQVSDSILALSARILDRVADRSPEAKARADYAAREAIFTAARGDGTTIDGRDVRLRAFPIFMDDPFRFQSGPRLGPWDPVEYAYAMIQDANAAFDRVTSEADRRSLREILKTRVAEIAAERSGRPGSRRFSPLPGSRSAP